MMPVIPDDNFQSRYYRAVGIIPEDLPEETSFVDTVKYQMVLDNAIVSPFFKNPNLPDSIVENENFNPLEYLTDDEKKDSLFVSSVTYADSEEEINAARIQYDQEKEWRDKRDNGSILGMLFAELIDPINLIPVGGAAYKSYKGGSSILNGALVTGTTMTGVTAAEEAILNHNQITRTYGESAANITANTLLGMVFGGGAVKLREYAEKAQVDYEKLLDEINYTMDPDARVAEGLNPSIGPEYAKSIGAAQVNELGDVQIRGKAAREFIKLLRLGPNTRTITSKSRKARLMSAKIAESALDLERPKAAPPIAKPEDVIVLEGETLEEATKRTQKQLEKSLEAEESAYLSNLSYQSIEQRIKQKEVHLYKAMMENNKIMTAYFESQGKNKGAANWLKSGFNRRAFNEEVAKAVRNGSDNEFVQRAADNWKQNFYDPLLKEAQDAGLISKEVNTKTALNYLNRTWDKDQIIENMPEFKKIVKQWIVSKNSEKLGNISADILALIDDASNLSKIENILTDKFPNENWVKEIINADSIVDQITAKITSSPDGRISYDYQIGENQSGDMVARGGGSGDGLKGAFRERSFLIPDELVQDFLINDIEELSFSYLKSMAPDIEFYKSFGDVNATMQKQEVNLEWNKIIEDAPKNKRKSLQRQRDRDLKDITGMIERLRGVYNVSEANSLLSRVLSAGRSINFLRLMGGVVPSSLPDMARIVMAEGFANVYANGLRPMIKNMKSYKVAAEDARGYAQGIDAFLGGRAEVIADVSYMTQPSTKVEKLISTASKKYSKINLMSQWTRFWKGFHGAVAQTRIADELISGVYDPRLKQLGIKESDASAISEQIKKYGYKEDGVWVINVSGWDRGDLALDWMAALRKESDRVIIVPGQEKPLFMSRDIGATGFQFKSFIASATVRMTASMLQKQDAYMGQGMLFSIGLGMVAYAFKEWNAGRELSDDPKEWVLEGIDRSGALGLIGEADNTITKLSRDSFGIRPVLGVDSHASRYASRSFAETALGPSVGLANDLAYMSGELLASEENGGRDITDSDKRTIRRIMPYQNLFYMRKFFDMMQESTGD